MNKESSDFAFVKVENVPTPVLVPISSQKPQIPGDIEKKWQQIVDLVARIMDVPTGLLTRFTRENLEVFLASNTEGNPYNKNDKDTLGIGMFCETVAGKQQEMLVQNSEDTPYWKNNPHAGLGMRSYIGIPIMWADGEIFGTFCMLNSIPNRFTEDFRKMLHLFKELIENDLKAIQRNHELEDKLILKEEKIREAHYMVRNHFNMLISFIHLQKESEKENLQETLSSIKNRIQSLGLIHEKLYSSTEYGDFPVDKYLQELCTLLIKDLQQSQIEIDYQIEPLVLHSEICVSLGLILSELITNILKYASAQCTHQHIELSLRPVTTKKLRFTLKESACCNTLKMLEDTETALGLSIIKIIAGQLGSTPRICEEEHLILEMDFPMEKK